MKIIYENIIKNDYDEDNKLIDMGFIKTTILVPEEGEKILNKKTLELYDGRVGIGTTDSVNNYEVVKLD